MECSWLLLLLLVLLRSICGHGRIWCASARFVIYSSLPPKMLVVSVMSDNNSSQEDHEDDERRQTRCAQCADLYWTGEQNRLEVCSVALRWPALRSPWFESGCARACVSARPQPCPAGSGCRQAGLARQHFVDVRTSWWLLLRTLARNTHDNKRESGGLSPNAARWCSQQQRHPIADRWLFAQCDPPIRQLACRTGSANHTSLISFGRRRLTQ